MIENQGFQLLELADKPFASPTDDPDDNLRLQTSDTRKNEDSPPHLSFETADALLEFVTRRWQERWVTTDIADTVTLDRFIIRPFFLLVSVDAPISLRWKRFTDRSVPSPYLIQSCVRDSLTRSHQMLEKAIRSTRSREIRTMERPPFLPETYRAGLSYRPCSSSPLQSISLP